jgi:glycine dehydrogenase subunit 1
MREFQSILLAKGGITITTTSEALALAHLESPGALGIEIACGEGQSLGLPLSFGGPYLGFLATRESHLRRLPGRLAGETVDSEGNRGFVLTLSTREQHIRREKATSNICTNQALCALSASIYMALMGPKGMQALALVNAKRAAFVREGLLASKKATALFNGPFFNEFAVALPKAAELERKGFVFGPPLAKDYPELKDGWLFAVTEMNDPATLKALVGALEAL